MKKDLSAVRRRAWATRRAKYGKFGHRGSYRCGCGRDADYAAAHSDMILLIVKLHIEGVISEGQASKAMHIGRIDLRKKADELRLLTPVKK